MRQHWCLKDLAHLRPDCDFAVNHWVHEEMCAFHGR